MFKFSKNGLFVVVFFIVILLILVGLFVFRSSNSESTDSAGSDTSTSENEQSHDIDSEVSEANSDIDFKEDSNNWKLWTGAMFEEMFSSGRKMHATYSYTFSYQLLDIEKSVVEIVVTDISTDLSFPNSKLIIIPYAHVSYSENGGSIPSTLMYEDWNTYGYTYIQDYSKMSSLGSTYSPTICAEDRNCDYLDEVGQKAGTVSLKFKYVGVGNSIDESPEYQSVNVIKAFGISPDQLSGIFSWRLTITLDDGTVVNKEYLVNVNGSTLDLDTSNTSTIESF